MKFETLITLNQSHEQIHQSEVLNNSEFDYRIYVNIIDLNQATGDKGYIVWVNVAKTVNEINKNKLNEIAETFCIEPHEVRDENVCEYGLCAKIDEFGEVINTKKQAIKIANDFIKKADVYKTLIGFYLDKMQNRIGNTGWDFLDGKIG